MKLTLILDAAPTGVRASLVEEWDEIGRRAKMAPYLRLFDTEDQALAWGRRLASRRGLKQLFLTDNRKSSGGGAGRSDEVEESELP
jgi:hypothetical protein